MQPNSRGVSLKTFAERAIRPAAWAFYVVIGFEILFMISPFALHFYAAYGPVLDLLHHRPATAWLTKFIATALLAVALFSLSLRELRAAGTSVRGSEPTTAIVRAGPYRRSRNPIYLSFFLLQLGLGIALGNAWVIGLLVPAAALISYVVVPREERYLASRFGSEYRDYRAAVRRWL